jgi:hypothetical protein
MMQCGESPIIQLYTRHYGGTDGSGCEWDEGMEERGKTPICTPSVALLGLAPNPMVPEEHVWHHGLTLRSHYILCYVGHYFLRVPFANFTVHLAYPITVTE